MFLYMEVLVLGVLTTLFFIIFKTQQAKSENENTKNTHLKTKNRFTKLKKKTQPTQE